MTQKKKNDFTDTSSPDLMNKLQIKQSFKHPLLPLSFCPVTKGERVQMRNESRRMKLNEETNSVFEENFHTR